MSGRLGSWWGRGGALQRDGLWALALNILSKLQSVATIVGGLVASGLAGIGAASSAVASCYLAFSIADFGFSSEVGRRISAQPTKLAVNSIWRPMWHKTVVAAVVSPLLLIVLTANGTKFTPADALLTVPFAAALTASALLQQSLYALGRFRRTGLILGVARATSGAVGIAAAAATHSVNALALTYGIFEVAATMVLLVDLRRATQTLVGWSGDLSARSTHRWLGLSSIANTLVNQSDTLLLNGLLSASSLGIFGVGSQLQNGVLTLGVSASAPLPMIVARRSTTPNQAQAALRRSLQGTLLISSAIGGVVTVVTVVASAAGLLGAHFKHSTAIVALVLIILSALPSAAAMVYQQAAIGKRDHARVGIARSVAAGAAVLIFIGATSAMGLIGAAFASVLRDALLLAIFVRVGTRALASALPRPLPFLASAFAVRRRVQGAGLILGFAVLAAAIAFGAIFEVRTLRPLVGVAIIAATAGQVVFLRRVTGLTFPFVALAVATVNLVGYFGYIFYPSIQSGAAVSASLPATSNIYETAAGLFAVTSVCLTIGGALGAIGPRTTSQHNMQIVGFLRQVKPGLLLGLCIVPLFCAVDGYSFHGLLNRPVYDIHYGPTTFVQLASKLIPIGVAFAALVLFGKVSAPMRFAAGAMIAVFTLIVFGEGSRSLGAIPVMIYLAYLLQSRGGGPRRRIRPIPVVFIAVVTLLLFQIPLNLRGNDQAAGLQPYFHLLISSPSTVLAFHSTSTFSNILFAVPLTGTIATSHPALPVHYFFVSISPLPGGMVGWPTVSPNLRLNAFTPYNALGELRVYGIGILVVYFVIVGVLITVLQRVAMRLPGARGTFSYLLVAAFTLLFSLGILQYNLRSDTRTIWYAIGIVIVMRVVPRMSEARSQAVRAVATRGVIAQV